jgi:hypothetical protein
MTTGNSYCLVELDRLIWPIALRIPFRRFRLLVAADVSEVSTDIISGFAYAALKGGMVYFCAWGSDCERFHDIVDEVCVEDDLGARRFAGPDAHDVIMTTSHCDDTLDEAVEYLINSTYPTQGFAEGSDYWIAICINNPEWAATIRQQFAEANRRT